MPKFSEQIVDDSGYRRPVEGALVFLLDRDGNEADIDSPNPTWTDNFGMFSFVADDGVYRFSARMGGVEIARGDALIGVPPEFKGDPGPADNTFTDYATFKASDTNRKAASLVGVSGVADGRFYWTLGDFSGVPAAMLDRLIVKADSTSLAVGAWVRDIDRVSVKDMGALGDGAANDTAAIQRAIDTGRDVYFPNGVYRTAGAIVPRVRNVGQTIYSDGNAKIVGNFDGFLFNGVGDTGGAISSVTAPIPPLTWTITMQSPDALSPGDAILLYDVVADEYEVNRVQAIVSNTIYCVWPITQPFPTPANVRLYRLNPIKDFSIKGLRLSNTHPSGGLVSMTYCETPSVEDCQLGPCGYIGVTFQSSLWPQMMRNSGRSIGASGIGFRVAKAGAIGDNTFIDTRSDESITLYKNCSHNQITNNRVAQNLNGTGSGAGNGILLDQRCYFNTIAGNQVEGSATYAIFLFLDCSYNRIVHNSAGRCNLGGIKVERNSNGNVIDHNVVLNVTDEVDPFAGGPTAAIRVEADCWGNRIGTNNLAAALAGSALIDRQAMPTRGFYQQTGSNAPAYRFGLTTIDFVQGSIGTTIAVGLGQTFGDTFAYIGAARAGDTVPTDLRLQPYGGQLSIGIDAVPTYASLGDAVAAGLPPGRVYKATNGQLMVVV